MKRFYVIKLVCVLSFVTLVGTVGLALVQKAANTQEMLAQPPNALQYSEGVEAPTKEEAKEEQEKADLQNAERGTAKQAEADGKSIEQRNAQTKHNSDKECDILLVNKDNPLPKDYEVTLKTMPDRTNKAAEEAYQPLCDMIQAGRKEGLYFEICSSYRSVERQQELFDEDVAALIRKGFSYLEAYAEVARETMPPGHSEHSTGLAFDIVALGYQMLDEGQERTAENKWLQEHCAEYGFILRYPKGKEDITYINYESWHYRYVGVEVAAYIMEKGITLEEYLEELNKEEA